MLDNILTGKSGGSPKYGCAFCDACTPYHGTGKLYSLGDLLELNKVSFKTDTFLVILMSSIIIVQEYVAAGSDKKKQKNPRFQNVTNPPLLSAEPEQKILGLLSVPELHCLNGKPNTIFLTVLNGVCCMLLII